MNIKELGVSTSAFGYSMGSTGKNTDRKNQEPWTLEQFVGFADSLGVGGVEAPISRFVPDLDDNRLEKLRSTLADRGMFFVIDVETALDAEQIRAAIPLAKKFQSPIIRIKSSNILECDRKKMGKPWPEHVAHCIEVLGTLSPELRAAGLKIAVENHQDLDSSDLLQIVEAVGSDVVGVTFDIGNAFSVCEDPLTFAEKLGPRIINIHIKDYKIFKSEDGFRLVRCPIGDGAVDFGKVLPFLAKSAKNAKMVIELGALEARNIAWLGRGFWKEIQPRSQTELAGFSKIIEAKSIHIQNDSWKTPWESGASTPDIKAYEISELEKSLSYLKTI